MFLFKASYGTLIKSKLADGVEMTGDLLLKISGQGAVYIRANVDEQSDDEEVESILHNQSDDKDVTNTVGEQLHDEKHRYVFSVTI